MWLTAGNLFHTVKLLVDSNVVKDMNKLKYYFLCLYIKMIRGSIDDDTVSICDGFTVPTYFTQKTFFKFSKGYVRFFWGGNLWKERFIFVLFFLAFCFPNQIEDLNEKKMLVAKVVLLLEYWLTNLFPIHSFSTP